MTSFVRLVGDNAFAAPERERRRDEITDGLANTIAAVEIANSSVHWLSPVDLAVDSMSFKINDGPRITSPVIFHPVRQLCSVMALFIESARNNSP